MLRSRFGSRFRYDPRTDDLAIYNAGGFTPKLVADFVNDYYRDPTSQRPFDKVLTFARAGLATMVDSDGLIKWAPHNLLSYSEQFDNAAWTKVNASVSADDIANPSGIENADKVIENTATSTHYINQSVAVPIGVYTFNLYLKANGRSWVLLNTFNGTDTHFAYFDLENVETGIESGTPNPTITDVGNGWRLCKITFTSTVAASVNCRILLASADGTNSYTGDGTSGVYAWGAHFYRSDLGGMVNNPDRGDSYVPTTSSAVYLPRRGHHKYNGDQWVNKGILAESEARTNLFPYSTPDDTNYSKGSITLTEDSAVSPTGETNAGLLTTSATSGLSYVFYSPISLTTGKATISAYVKEGNHSVFWLYTLSVAVYGLVYFDISDQSIQVTAGATTTPDGGTIEYVGNGWYRISATMNVAIGATTGCGIGISDAKGATAVSDGKTGYFYGVQVEQASTCSSLIPTNGSSVTRAAETITVPYANLPWPTPTYIGDELVTNGTFDTDSNWIQHTTWNIAGGVATHSATGGGGLSQSWTPTAGSVYEITFTVSGATSGDFYYAFSSASGLVADQIKAPNRSSNGTYKEYLVADGTTVYHGVWGTSTFDGSVDNISVREINPLSVSIAMMGEANYADTNDPNEILFYRWYQDLNNRIQSYLSTSSSLVGGVYFYQNASGTADLVTVADIYSPDLNLPFNISSRHGSTFINGAIDGTALTADTTPVALPDLSATDLRLAHTYMGTISEFRIWDRDIQDTGIAEATKPSLEPSLSLTFDGQPSSFTNTGLTL